MTARALPALSWTTSRTWMLASAAVLAGLVLLATNATQEPGLYRACVASTYLAVLAWVAVHDIRTLRAPNVVVLPAAAAAVVHSTHLGMGDFIEAVVGGAVAFAVLLVIAILGRGAMGFGDVKVGIIAGLAAGLHGVFMMLVLTFGMGAAFAGVMLLARLRRRKDVVAFTPFLAIAVAILFMTGGSYLIR
jgi:prepilin signal peptidase PulO-like enzyme (type II secretory pathway)